MIQIAPKSNGLLPVRNVTLKKFHKNLLTTYRIELLANFLQ